MALDHDLAWQLGHLLEDLGWRVSISWTLRAFLRLRASNLGARMASTPVKKERSGLLTLLQVVARCSEALILHKEMD